MAANVVHYPGIYMYGMWETVGSLLVHSPAILLGCLVCAHIGHLAAGSAAAFTAEKIAYCVLSVFYGMGHPYVVSGITTSTDQTVRFLGNITPLVIPPLFFI